MNKIIITAEGTCDLTQELCEKYNIRVIGLNLTVDGVEFNSVSKPIASEDFTLQCVTTKRLVQA